MNLNFKSKATPLGAWSSSNIFTVFSKENCSFTFASWATSRYQACSIKNRPHIHISNDRGLDPYLTSMLYSNKTQSHFCSGLQFFQNFYYLLTAYFGFTLLREHLSYPSSIHHQEERRFRDSLIRIHKSILTKKKS